MFVLPVDLGLGGYHVATLDESLLDKSTFLNLVASVESVDAECITFNDRNLTQRDDD